MDDINIAIQQAVAQLQEATAILIALPMDAPAAQRGPANRRVDDDNDNVRRLREAAANIDAAQPPAEMPDPGAAPGANNCTRRLVTGLPRWSEFHSFHSFVERFRLVLEASAIPLANWRQFFPLCLPENEAR